ncbi:TRAP transporter permease [Alkalilimnicola sp. S0819]|uniref:TRAP transporter permease n=1 Tax=Alkalilimnicola sp. S0819 TaxID=2613922 RepID=UPI001262352F|nr:TRAP transporter fused permease subunit [Alkalilimnicola sp. S0819]KAB7619514.1 TRAP transporter fused permease subunit [Alkalilimnicola sp. S0819]MPQ17662.1 TRAP transporter fused permease subunit [Alkalilimnicola sp. S0819]
MTRLISGALCALLTIMAIGWALNAPRWFGLSLYTEQYLAAVLAVALPIPLLEIGFSGRPRQGRGAPFYDWIAAVAVMLAAGYTAVHYDRLILAVYDIQTDALLVSVICVLGLLEAVRRVAGNFLMGLLAVFVLLGLFGHHLPAGFQGREVPLGELFVYLGTDANAVLGTALVVSATVVVAFLLIGELLFRSGGANFFTDIAMSLMGRYRGGPAKIAITASGLFGSVSGSAVSNVASTGVVTIPLMRKTGYAPKDAAAVEAVASTGGQLMPPVMGAVAFLMAEFLQIPYSQVVLAALVPAMLYYISLFIMVDLYAVKHRIAALEESEIPNRRQVLRRGGVYVLPFVVLIVALFGYAINEVDAALMAAVCVLVLGVVFGYGADRLNLRNTLGVLAATGRTVTTVIVVAAGAGIVIGVLNMTGLGFTLTDMLARVGEGNLALLLGIVAVLAVILGMGMPTVGVYVLLATLLAPSLVAVGVEPIAAHLFILYYGMLCMITPPVALAAFTAASISGTAPMSTAVRSAVFGWVAYLIPFLFVLSPSLLLQGGSWLDNAATLLTAIAGLWAACGAIAGYLLLPLTLPRRLLWGAAGLLLLIPQDATTLGWWPGLVGLLLGALLLVSDLLRRRARLAAA